ncbi:hypothetical protein HRW23_20880 [Streptomyces lunaelactis]|uniref:hypothetical protein n=1 Tax=Streptomyces lunaelactis TaxID=1535768 RepID=UPI0015848CF4|nr:hypothetical protein [Streptomyces lunaelactis]NUK03599.1 hypothetical protein [Streptomyces lunaelactis]NUK18022.1 hypothetical protein [Streptomyces lunaelactis]NUK25294.1 hypothetical protein [Streptomyces lunaelactis]NUK52189.1 hypothetical protein [Streptomyces lunaelactis]NUK68792.1 hypothetical protein [Streptomyces lunaelactis]
MRSFLSTVSVLLIVLVAVLTPLSALAVWVDREIDETDSYVATTEPLASDARVQNAVAVRITDEIMKRIDAGPFQEGVETLVHDAVVSFAGTSAFKTAWNTVNRAAHTAVEEALADGGDNAITIDLAPVTEQVKRQLADEGVPFVDQVPVELDRVTILESDNLGTVRDIFHALRIAGVWLPVATILLAAAAVLLAVRRGRALIGLGLALAAGAVLLRIAVAAGRDLSLDDLPPDVDRPAAEAVYDALTATLRTTAWWLSAAGLALAVGAWVLERRRLRRVSRVSPGHVVAVGRGRWWLLSVGVSTGEPGARPVSPVAPVKRSPLLP